MRATVGQRDAEIEALRTKLDTLDKHQEDHTHHVSVLRQQITAKEEQAAMLQTDVGRHCCASSSALLSSVLLFSHCNLLKTIEVEYAFSPLRLILCSLYGIAFIWVLFLLLCGWCCCEIDCVKKSVNSTKMQHLRLLFQ